MRSIVSLLVVAGLLVGTVACHKETPEEKAQQEFAKAMQQLGQAAEKAGKAGAGQTDNPLAALQGMTQAMKKQSETAAGGPIVVASKEALTAVLPDFDGWAMDTPSYRKSVFGGLETSELSATYRNGRQQLQVRLTDTGTAAALLAPVKMVLSMNLQHEDDEGFERIGTIHGVPVIEKYVKASRHAEFSMIVRDRFLVSLSSGDLDDVEPLRAMAGKLGLSALK